MNEQTSTALLNPPIHPPRQLNPLAAQITKQLEMKKELYGDPLLRLSECLPALGDVSLSTLRKQIAAGRIKTWRNSPRGHHKIRLSELRRFLAQGDTHPAVSA
jgi:hypothetical protein